MYQAYGMHQMKKMFKHWCDTKKLTGQDAANALKLLYRGRG